MVISKNAFKRNTIVHMEGWLPQLLALHEMTKKAGASNKHV